MSRNRRPLAENDPRVIALLDLKSLIDNKRYIGTSDFAIKHKIDRGYVSMLERYNVVTRKRRGIYEWTGITPLTPQEACTILDMVLDQYNEEVRQRNYTTKGGKTEEPPAPPSPTPEPEPEQPVRKASELEGYKVVHYEEVGKLEGFVVLKVIAYKNGIPPSPPKSVSSAPRSNSF